MTQTTQTTLDTPTDPTAAADAALKAKHRALWALGDYAAVATEVIAALGPRLVDACAVDAGDRVLDIAAGSGNAAIPAAARGAVVTASDLTPELLETGAQHAADQGVAVDWRVGRCGGAALCGRVVRRGAVVRGDHVRAAPPGQR